jgi:hypothetical protein
MTPEHADTIKHATDGLSFIIALGALVDLLPSIAALLSIVWLLIQISQSARFAQFSAWIGRTWRRLRGR